MGACCSDHDLGAYETGACLVSAYCLDLIREHAVQIMMFKAHEHARSTYSTMELSCLTLMRNSTSVNAFEIVIAIASSKQCFFNIGTDHMCGRINRGVNIPLCRFQELNNNSNGAIPPVNFLSALVQSRMMYSLS